jgi:hypothetical protein
VPSTALPLNFCVGPRRTTDPSASLGMTRVERLRTLKACHWDGQSEDLSHGSSHPTRGFSGESRLYPCHPERSRGICSVPCPNANPGESTGVAQAGRDPVDGCGKSAVDGVGIISGTLAPQQIDLDETDRIHIRIPQPNGAGENLVVLQQL